MNEDIYGLYLMRYFQREGNEFPVPFQIDEFTKYQFMCRNPRVLGLMIFMIGTLFYGPISYGRLLFTLWFQIITYINVVFEEEEKI